MNTIIEGDRRGRVFQYFPKDYVVVDTETTGLDCVFDRIIEISAIRYQNYQKVGEFTSFINPHRKLKKEIRELTGITDEMVKSARNADVVLKEFLDFIGDLPVVGYNVKFDMGFIHQEVLEHAMEFPNHAIDVLKMARALHPDLPRHRQADLAEFYKIENTGAHRSLFDCQVCATIFDSFRKEVEATPSLRRNYEYDYQIKVRDIYLDVIHYDKLSPVYRKDFVFSGKLSSMSREEAMKAVLSLGGYVSDGLTKRTDYLVLGMRDPYFHSESRKQMEAEERIENGATLQIIDEETFLQMISKKGLRIQA